MNAWDHLPNAKHIDRVLASVKANPEKWDAAMAMTRNKVSGETLNEVLGAALDAAWDAAYVAAWDAAYYPAWGAIEGLIAHDDCAYMLDSTPDDLLILHALGDKRAALFIPAAIVFSEKNITEVA